MYMKKAGKIFIIISIVCASIGLLVGGFFLLKSLFMYKVFNNDMLTDLIRGVIIIIVALIPLIIGIKAYKELNNATKRDDLITIGIITLIFCSFLGGLFMLLMQDSDFA